MVAWRFFLTGLGLAAASCAALAQEAKGILVVTAGSADYMFAAGGTLAKFIRDGYTVNVAQLGNDEKLSAGLDPAQTRLAGVEEGRQAAKLLGVKDTVYLGHKSGELGYISSTEMRNQLFALIRHFRPRIIFIPDPYVHYQPDWDQYYVGRMAEEAWGYSGTSTFGNELARVGLRPYGAPEIYYYAMERPYRPREGGEGRAKFLAVDITSTIANKIGVIELLRTRNRLSALETKQRLDAAGRSSGLLAPLDEAAVTKLARAYVEQLAEAIGQKHGWRYGEEFNHVGGGSDELPAFVRQRAKPK